MKSRRRIQLGRQSFSGPAEVLESRTLLAAVVGSISINGQAPRVLTQVNGVDLLALSDDDSTRLFASNGTQAGTAELSDIPITEITHFQLVGQNLFVAGRNGLQTDLWRASNEPGDSILVKSDILLSTEPDADFTVFDGDVYFAANGDDPGVGTELFKSDGGPAVLVADIAAGVRPEILSLPPDRGISFEIWINELDQETRQTVRTRVIQEFNVPAANTYEAHLPDGLYRYWIRPTDANGNVGDWSTSRDEYVVQAVYNSEPGGFTVFNGELYFAATTPNSGRELWKTDGTIAGTARVDPLEVGVDQPFKNEPGNFVEFDGNLFFSSEAGLSRTDGTTTTGVNLGLNETVLPRDITPVGVTNGHLFIAETPRFSRDGDTIALHSLSSATDIMPEELHRIPGRIEGSVPAYSRFDSFAVINNELAFLSVQHTATNSYNLSPSDDRHLPSSVPRNWFEKEGRWYLSDGTASGTKSAPGFAYDYAEDDTAQLFSDFTLNDTAPLGDAVLLVDNDTTIFDDDEIRRVSRSNDVAVIGPTALAGSRREDLMSITSGGIREENITFQSLSSVDVLADGFWVTAEDGNGTSLYRVELDVNNRPGPVISGLDPNVTAGIGPVVVRSEGFVSFSWADDGQSTFDLLIHEVSFQYGQNASPVVNLQDVGTNSHQVDLKPGTYRIQVRSRASDDTASLWTEVLLRVSEAQLPGPAVLTPVQNSNPVFYETAPISWQSAGFGDAVSFDIQTTAGLIKGISSTSTTVPAAAGHNSVSVRARYADGTVTAFGSLSTFIGAPSPNVTNAAPLGNGFYRIDIDTADDIRSIAYDLTDVNTGERISDGASPFARENNAIWIPVPYSGRFRVGLRTILRTNDLELYSGTSEYTFDAQVDHEISKAHLQAGVDGTELTLDWHHPDAQSYSVALYYVNDPTHGSQLIGELATTQENRQAFTVPADSDRFRAVVTARNSAGLDSEVFTRIVDRDEHVQIKLLEGQGAQATSRPAFRWEAPFDGLPDVEGYELLLSGENESYRRNNIQSTTHTVDTDMGTGRYQIYLRAQFADGTTSPWNLHEGVLQLTSTVPGPPQITGPASSVSTRRPALKWQSDSAASHFEVWLSTESSVTPVIHETQHTGNQLTPNADLAAGQYRLWVRTHYSDGTRTRWTATYRFTIVDSDVVQITSGIGAQPAGQQTIGWDAVPNAVSYEIYVNDVNSRHTATYRQTGITTTSHPIGVTLAAGRSYEIWMRAHLADGTRTRWGNSPPILTVESGISITQPVLVVTANTASWEAISGATQYELWVNEVDSTNPNRNIRVRAFRELLTGTSQDLGLSAGTYRGWIRSIAVDGTRSLWSDGTTFVIS